MKILFQALFFLGILLSALSFPAASTASGPRNASVGVGKEWNGMSDCLRSCKWTIGKYECTKHCRSIRPRNGMPEVDSTLLGLVFVGIIVFALCCINLSPSY